MSIKNLSKLNINSGSLFIRISIQGRVMRPAYNFFLYLFMFLPLTSFAKWPDVATNAYVKRCANQMEAQGWTPRGAYSLCTCFAGFMEVMDYDELMKATPVKGASGANGQLYRGQAQCVKYFPLGKDPVDSNLYSAEGYIKPPPFPD